MPLTRFTLGDKPTVTIDVLGGRYRIATHTQNELLIDARKTHNKSVLPHVEVRGREARIGKQPLLRWFVTKAGVDAKIIVPENTTLVVKMFSGELTVTGRYERIEATVRCGNVWLEGPFFEYAEPGFVKIVNGNLRCYRLSEAGYEMPLTETKVRRIENSAGVSLSVQLNLGELDFS